MRMPEQKFFVPANIFIAGRFDRLRTGMARSYNKLQRLKKPQVFPVAFAFLRQSQR